MARAHLTAIGVLYTRVFPTLVVALLLSACSAVNWDYPRVPSKAFAHPETTSIGALFGEAADKHPGLSGFSLVQYGENGFLARLAMIDRGIGASGEGMHLKKLSILIGATLFSIAGCGPQFVLPKTKDRPGTDRRKRVYAEWLL